MIGLILMLASVQSKYGSLLYQTTENEAAAEVVSAFEAEVEEAL